MPGRWNWSRSAVTSGVISPRSSAMKRQGAEALLDGLEELGARASDPLARLRRRGSRRHVPGRREGAEMIQPDHVHLGQQRAKAVDAPAISALAKRVPVVDGVAPELPVRAEVVGRHSGDDRRVVVGVEQEQLGVGPDVARVGRDEERQIADQPHAPVMRVFARDVPPGPRAGTEQSERRRSGSPARAAPGQRGRGAPDQLDRPLEIAGAVVPGLQRAEQGVVVQPEPVGLTELFIGGPEIRTGAGAEAAPRRLEQAEFERDDLLVFDGGRRKRVARAIRRLQQPVVDQGVRADQQLVAGERRQALIRRVAIPGRSQRQRLPPALPGLVEAVHPCERGRPEIADAVGGRQRRDVQQHARRAVSRRKRRNASRPASLMRRSHGAVDDGPSLGHDGVQVRLVDEALRVDLVDVLGARRPGREPAASGHDLQAADRGAIARGANQLGDDADRRRSSTPGPPPATVSPARPSAPASPARRRACSAARRTPPSSSR